MPSAHPSLLLASASPARRSTLQAAGVDPLVRVSSVDEDAVVAEAVASHGPLEAADVALLLARAKAEDVVAALEADAEEWEEPGEEDEDDGVAEARSEGRGPGSAALLVLGCDSVLELDGEVHGKPADAAEAVARWRTMRGHTGHLHTGHWLVDLRDREDGGTGGMVGGTATTTVHFADLDDAEIDDYVATGEPLRVAGSFTLDGRSAPWVTGVVGDHTNVVGLSLPTLRDLLGRLEISVIDLWDAP